MATVSRQQGVRLKRWNKRDFYRLAELGFFQGQKVELLEGILVVQSPQNEPHFAAISAVQETLMRFFATGYYIRAQGPLDLGQATEPEPDIAVVVGSRADYPRDHPTTAVLIVEVSDSTLSSDRRRKGSLYARAGIQDYWIVNLVDRQLEVYRSPVPAARTPYGHRYSWRNDLTPPATVSPLVLPQAAIPVAELLG